MNQDTHRIFESYETLSDKPEKIVTENGVIFYHVTRNYIHLLHREDGPAIEYPDGCKEWFINGKRHRKKVDLL